MRPNIAAIHRFSISKAHKIQLRLSQRIISKDRMPQRIKYIAGVDVAYSNHTAIGAVAVLDYKSLKLQEFQTAMCKAKFPYIPTLLSFREIPSTIACIKKLTSEPHVLLANGQGIAHPYGCGFASHLGLAIGKPTIGVAKGKLIGEPITISGQDFLVQNEQIIGAIVTTKEGKKPVYVSIGHMTSLETAVKITKHCALNNRIPEPLFQAHRIASEEKHKIQAKHKAL